MSQSHSPSHGPDRLLVDPLLIGGAYEVDGTRPLAACADQPAFAVRDHRLGRTDLMAVQVHPRAPARPEPLAALAGMQIEHVLLPIDHGPGRLAGGGQAWFVVMPRPPGPALVEPGALRFTPWRDAELIDCVLRPMALMLDQLAAAGVTHRAIRLGNLFRAHPGQPVTAGDAWSAPPASLQPAIFEPPYAAVCHPAGRGNGTIADDVYALGVVMLALAGGRLPMAGQNDAGVIAAKLHRGSFAALAGDLRLSSGIADLIRGMLAEDPEHRPAPVLLADPLAARSRRVAARPPQRAQRPIEVAGLQAWDARGLAHGLSTAGEQGAQLLRSATLDTWLRRMLGDPALAARIEEVVRLRAADQSLNAPQADGMLVMRSIAILDPLAPLCWRGLTLFPDAIGPVLAQDNDDVCARAEAIVQLEVASMWAEVRHGRPDPALLRLDTRQQRLLLRIGGWAGGRPRLGYSLNPLLACRSRLVGSACVVRLTDLLPALERQASERPASERQSGGDLVIDREIAAFIAARYVGRLDADLAILAQPEDQDIDPPGHRGLAQLRILAALCLKEPSVAWPQLCAAAHRPARLALARWRARTGRAAREASLAMATERGSLVAMLAVLEDGHASEQDALGHLAAEAELRRIERALEQLAAQRPARAAAADVTGQEIAAAMGVIAVAVSAVMAALP